MADKFGAAHRQLVEDTNDGKRIAPPAAPTTSVGKQRIQTRTVGSDDNTQLYQGLLNVGTEVLRGMKKRQDEQNYIKGYNKGLDEGFVESERSPIRDLLFGPSPTLRGAQQRIIENDSRRWLNSRMKSMEDDMMSFDEDEYQTELSSQLQAVLEDHEDPEIIAQITKTATKNFETLARNHAQARQMWIANANTRAVQDSINEAVLGMRSAQQYGDTQAQKDAQADAELMFDQPLDMNPDVWLETINKVVIDNLSTGDDLAYRMAEQKGIVDMMSPTEQKRLATAYSMFDAKNGRKFHIDQTALVEGISKGTMSDADLVAFKQAYPEQGPSLNQLRADKVEQDAVLAEIARQKALTINELVSGDVKFTSRTPAEQREAVETVFNSIADEGLRVQRQAAYQEGTYTGDMEADFTAEQRRDYMLDKPMQFAQVWAQHPEVKTPLVQNLATSMISDLRMEDLDEEGVQHLRRKFEALQQFEALDGGNFHNQFRSDEDAQMFAAYSYLVKDAGYNPINAAREMRTIASREAIDVTEDRYVAAINANIDDLADSFLDQSPESQKFFGLFTVTPDNEQAFNHELQQRLTESLKMFKGDMSKALPAAEAAVRRNGIVSNGQFIPNGRSLDIKAGTLEDYMRGLNVNDEARAAITNSGAGFAPDVDYTTLELSVNPFNKKAVIMHGRHEATGQPISISLNLPQQGSDYTPYGFNSFTGYNPNIADTDERRKAFLRNNKLMQGYTTVGRAIEKFVKGED